MIKLIATDMDGTFLRDDKTYNTKRFEAIAKQLRAKGIIGVIASGNSFDHIEKPFYLAEKDWLYFAGDNGNHIKYRQISIKTTPIDRHIAEHIAHFIKTLDGYYPLISTTKTAYVFQTTTKQAIHQFEEYNVEVIPIYSFTEIPQNESIVKISIASEHTFDTNKQMVQTLRQQFPSIIATTSGDIWIDIYDQKGGKGSAIKYLKNKFNLLPEECIAFGDNLNDKSMMQEVYYSVAMKNADPELAKICQYQIGTNNEQSVIDILELIATHNQLDFMNDYKQN